MDGCAWPHHTRLGDLDAATARALDHPDTPVAEAAGAYAAAFAVWTGALMAGLLRLCAQVAAGTGGPDAAPTLKAMATRMVAECDSQEEALLGFAKRALVAIPYPPPPTHPPVGRPRPHQRGDQRGGPPRARHPGRHGRLRPGRRHAEGGRGGGRLCGAAWRRMTGERGTRGQAVVGGSVDFFSSPRPLQFF